MPTSPSCSPSPRAPRHSGREDRSPEPHGRSNQRSRRDTQSSPPRHSATNHNHSRAQAVNNTVTRQEERIKDLECQLASARTTKENENRKRKPADPVTVYEDIHTLLTQYDEYRDKKYHLASSDDDEDDELDLDEEKRAQELEEKRRLERGYNAVLILNKSVFPKFLEKIKGAEGEHIIRELQKGANSSRAFDTSKVLNFIGDELNKEVQSINQTRLKEYEDRLRANVTPSNVSSTSVSHMTGSSASPSTPVLEQMEEFRPNSRDNRGLQNDITGRLLCPAEFDWNDLEVRAAVRAFNSEYDFGKTAHARCFYKEELFDPEDLDKGFLQSYLLLQVYHILCCRIDRLPAFCSEVYRLIFTSPSSTKDQPQNVDNLPAAKKPKTSSGNHRAKVAQIIQMNEVKPRSIAYAAIHLHFALSDASHWTESHMGYNYLDLWNFVVDFFEDPGDEEGEKRAQELLKWWNDRIFTGIRSAANSRGTKMTSRKQDMAKRAPRPALQNLPGTSNSVA
ncbi:hypothetical protein EV360DRAFT_85034 [Lentinula raphanica]|nr:hypothetical protein EV360DRAFT_85034 [Lentinula raphanica]